MTKYMSDCCKTGYITEDLIKEFNFMDWGATRTKIIHRCDKCGNPCEPIERTAGNK